MSFLSESWPSDVRPPLTVNNANNHSGLIVVLTGLCLCLHIVAISARIYSSGHKSSLSSDDYAFAVLSTAAIIQVSLVFAEVHYGWGTRMDSNEGNNEDQMLKIGYTADIFAILVLGLSKITVCIFYEGLFSQMQRRVIRGLLLGMLTWTLLSVLLLAIRCSSSPWDDISTTQCNSLYTHWLVVTITDIITEGALLVYVFLAIYQVRITTTKKIIVFCALESRVILIPLAAIRLHYVKAQLDSEVPTLIGSFATVCTELYLAFSVNCLLTAFLKSFIAVYEDEIGISYTYRAPSKNGSKGKSHSGSGSGISKPRESDFHRHSHRGGNPDHSIKGWEREEDPIMDNIETGRGLHIMKTVHYSVEDESIELSERAGSSML